jgi:soluble lytic murein transglycosylase-like protein
VADYNASSFPTSYNDPAYAAADQSASNAVGIPQGWLSNIRTKGEKSDADQVSSAGAKTPYQITPDTRAAIMSQTGVDPYLSPSTAAYGAAYLLKQSLDRNGGNPILATAEYHGGTDPDNWGPKTMAYGRNAVLRADRCACDRP